MTARVALVTGGTGGIGTAIVKQMHELGHKVVTNYRNQEKMEAWREKMHAEGITDITTVQCDICDLDTCRDMAQQIETDVGPVDILVNNAGITRDSTFHKMDADAWNSVVDTNLNAVFNVTRVAIEGMRERKWGRIVQISSINGQKGQYGQANYAAAKAGMHGFTISLARENAKHGITVNTVSPGYVATDMVMAVPQEVRDKIVAEIPAGRLGRPDEIAHAVAFFADEKSAWITGSNLAINGGHYMGW